jgi:LPXTG-site transpeptidase (sortase) family protein
MRFYFLISGIVLIVFAFTLPKSSPTALTTSSITPSPTGVVASFATEPVTIDRGLLKDRSKQEATKAPPERILIPDLGLDVPVKTAEIVKGYWEVFPDSAGFGLGSAYPDENGNQVIFAHAREGLFLPLKKAKEGQKILVLTRDKWYSYEITGIKSVSPDDTDVIAPSDTAVLTLYTCTGFADSKRLIVTAKKVS